MQEQQASLDFAYQAVGRIAPLAKQIIAQHYAKAPDRSYFTGCSTGGREAMLMAQRHPTFFDGIISGAPAMRTAYSGIGDEWVATMLNTAATKDATGKVDPRTVLSDAQKKAVIDGVLNACDAGDGVKDDMIFNTNACRFDPKTLVCGANKTESCLTMAQATALEKGFAGRRTRRAVRCIPASCSIRASRQRRVFRAVAWRLESGRTAILSRHDGRRCTGGGSSRKRRGCTQRHIQLDESQHVLESRRQADVLPRCERPVVLRARHHRLLRAHDESQRRSRAGDELESACICAQAWATAAADRSRSTPSTCCPRSWIGWRRAQRPASVVATGRALPGRSRPLCAYPQHAHYKGSGDTQDAKNFECRN
jgi:feruloyl esterase